MWNITRIWGHRRGLRKYKHRINDALALQERNEVRSDGLALHSTRNRLEIRWRARDVHPWDCGLSAREKERAYFRQLMEDTEAAVVRLFERLPEVDEIDLKVLDLQSETILVSGTVQRVSLTSCSECAPSVRMRLTFLGVRCHFAADAIVNVPVSETESELRIA
jgi:hypothetical protein